MSIFKNTVTGYITTVFGPLHDNFVLRADEELVLDDREGVPAQPVEAPASEPDDADPSSSGKKSEISQESTTPDAAGVGNPKE